MLEMNDYSIQDKVIIVTGATKGMGLCTGQKFESCCVLVIPAFTGMTSKDSRSNFLSCAERMKIEEQHYAYNKL